MASIRETRARDRYSAFDTSQPTSSANGNSTNKKQFTNRWEIVLVLIVVAAGIVITTIAAIKAKGKLVRLVDLTDY